MRTVQQALTLAILGLFLNVPLFGQSQNTGCRSLTEPVWYEYGHPHSNRAFILGVGRNETNSVLTVVTGDRYYHSLDHGSSWTETKNSPDAYGYVASADPKIIYWYETAGVINRSDNGGKSWVIPAENVDGQANRKKAFQMSGDHAYDLEFEIAAVHPEKPLTVYATVSAMHERERKQTLASIIPCWECTSLTTVERIGQSLATP